MIMKNRSLADISMAAAEVPTRNNVLDSYPGTPPLGLFNGMGSKREFAAAGDERQFLYCFTS